MLGSDLRLVPFAELEPAKPDLHPVEQKEEERPERRVGVPETDLSENAPKQGKALIEVAGADELLRGAPLKFQRLRRGRPLGRGKVGARGFGAAAVVGQRVPEADLKRAPCLRFHRSGEIQGEAVETGRALEGQRFGSLACCGSRVLGGAFEVFRLLPVHGEPFGICLG